MYREREREEGGGYNKLRGFFEKLTGGSKERGFFFTLNQDLFIERSAIIQP